MKKERKPDKFPDRNEYIGPSEAAIACGLSTYSDPAELWEVKTLRRARTKTSQVMERGNMMEPVILKRLEEDHGLSIASQQLEFTDPIRPWLRGHCDGIIVDYKYIGDGYPLENVSGAGICEVKAPGSRMAQKFMKNGLTPDYILQVQLYMYLADVRWASVFFLDYDSNIIRQIDMEFSPGFMADVLKTLDSFWEFVTRDIRPPDVTPPLEVPGPNLNETHLVGSFMAGHFVKAMDELVRAKELAKQWEDAVKKEMTRVDKTKVECAGMFSATWKTSERTTTDGKKLFDWVEVLCLAIEREDADAVTKMAELFLSEDDMFSTTKEVRTFRKKIVAKEERKSTDEQESTED